jgi:hypothetical protein
VAVDGTSADARSRAFTCASVTGEVMVPKFANERIFRERIPEAGEVHDHA